MRHRPLQVLLGGSIFRQCRFYSVSANTNIRERLMAEVKTAMKNKDSCTSTTLRSVLSEIYATDKILNEKVPPSVIFPILRRAMLRRNDSATQFIRASRPDLAEKEQREADVLSTFLPPLLSEVEIDRILSEIINKHSEGDPNKSLGKIFKAFYSTVDKISVDPDVVKRRAAALLSDLR